MTRWIQTSSLNFAAYGSVFDKQDLCWRCYARCHTWRTVKAVCIWNFPNRKTPMEPITDWKWFLCAHSWKQRSSVVFSVTALDANLHFNGKTDVSKKSVSTPLLLFLRWECQLKHLASMATQIRSGRCVWSSRQTGKWVEIVGVHVCMWGGARFPPEP